MPIIDPTTPSGVQPVGFSSGFTLIMSDEFNSTGLDNKWNNAHDFGNYGSTSAWDVNNSNNSCLRMWYNGAGGGTPSNQMFGSNGAARGGQSWRGRFGYYEARIQCIRGRGFFPGFWLYPLSDGNGENGDGSQQEIDIDEWFSYENGDWLVDTSAFRCKNSSFTIWTEGGGGSTNQAGHLSFTNTRGYDTTVSTQFHTYAMYWASSGGLKWYYDGNLLGTINDPWGAGNNMQLVVFLQLWWGPGGGNPTPDGNTPQGSSNSMIFDYVRVWSIAGSPSPAPPPPPPPPFSASLTTAPTDGATISGTVNFQIDGQGIKNAELLPATGYTPSYGTFTLSNNGAHGDFNWNTTNVANGPISVRISAFDQAAGVSPANEIVAMASRTYNVNNSPSSPPPPPPPPGTLVWPYGRNSSGFDNMTFYDEFDSGTTPDTSRWTNHYYYEASNSTVNYDVNGGYLRIWPKVDGSNNFFNRVFTTENFFTQQYGYFEVRAQLDHGDGLHPVIGIIGNNNKDVGYMHAYGNAPSGGWTSGTAVIDYACAVFDIPTQTFNFDTRPGTAALGGANLANSFHYYACEWTPNNIRFFYDGTQVEECVISVTGQFYPYVGLAMQTNETTANTTGTPQGTANAMLVDYVHVWTLHNNANSVPGTSAPAPFGITQVTAPPDGASISGVVAFRVEGNLLANVELLPATGYTPIYGQFSLSSGNTVAELNWSSTAVANGAIQVRISAFDHSAGQAASELVAMQPRTYYLNNTAAPPGPAPTPTPVPPPPPTDRGLQYLYSELLGRLPWIRRGRR